MVVGSMSLGPGYWKERERKFNDPMFIKQSRNQRAQYYRMVREAIYTQNFEMAKGLLIGGNPLPPNHPITRQFMKQYKKIEQKRRINN